MNNLQIYNAVRAVPTEAKKEIRGGRMNGKTDINPMWRIKTLTEQFGPCGIGWTYEILEERLEPGANGEVAAFVKINLYVKSNGEWSKPIPGSGGSMFVAKEKSGLYTNDEAFKMALTDALSVSCKALGVAADVYWDKDRTKYDRPADTASAQPQDAPKCVKCGAEFKPFTDKQGKQYTAQEAMLMAKKARGGVALCKTCYESAAKQ